MEIVIGLIVLYVLYNFYKNWQYNQPQNIIERLEESVLKAEDALQKAINKEEKGYKENWDYNREHNIKTKKELHQRIKSDTKKIDDARLLSKQMKQLIAHLQEKYKYDTKQQIYILDSYKDWLYFKEDYHRFYEKLEYVDDVAPLQEQNDENYLKAITIEKNLIKQADKDVLKTIGLKS